jgi:hypothetical protein
MDPQTYDDTLSALVESNNILKQENENLHQINEKLHLSNVIRPFLLKKRHFYLVSCSI